MNTGLYMQIYLSAAAMEFRVLMRYHVRVGSGTVMIPPNPEK